jgi:uncharacterized protein (TIGR02266 family)
MDKMSEQEKGDQRRNLRAPLLIQKVKMDDGRRVFFGYAKNVSRSGLFIATTNPRAPGETFQVEIPLPAPINRKVVCQCEVVWKREYARNVPMEPGMGLKFTDMPEDMAKEIENWIAASGSGK